MNTLGIYIYNSTQNAWLQEDEKSWGPFSSAGEFTPGNERTAEAIRLSETKGDDTTFTVALLH